MLAAVQALADTKAQERGGKVWTSPALERDCTSNPTTLLVMIGRMFTLHVLHIRISSSR